MPFKRWFTTRWLVVVGSVAIWFAVEHFGGLTFLENKLIDWRFVRRGEIEAPVKVIYVDVDSVSIDRMGGMPWSRAWFSHVSEALVTAGRATAVGIDFVFSEKAISRTVAQRTYLQDNGVYASFLNGDTWQSAPDALVAVPPVVIAASFSSSEFIDINGVARERDLPLVAKPLLPVDQVEPPEKPAFRLRQGSEGLYTPPLLGIIDTLNGETRAVPAFAETREGVFYHMAVRLAAFHFGAKPDAEGIQIRPHHIDLVRPDGSLATRIPLLERQIVEVNWFTPWKTTLHPRFSFADVMGYAQMLKPNASAEEQAAANEFFAQFEKAIVLIGPVDPLLQDLATTSLDRYPVPKVSVHGNLLKTIVSGRYLHRLPEWAVYAVIAVLTIVVSQLAVAGGVRGVRWKLLAVFVLSAYSALSAITFAEADWVLPMAVPLAAAFTTSFAAVSLQLIAEEKQKSRIKGMFGTYVAPALVERMVNSGEEPKLGGVEENITAYFSDIQSFSSFSEKLSPQRLVELMNEYLTACTDIVQAEGGTLDKYIGDAVVAMYGAPLALPDHAYRSCVAAMRVHRRIHELRAKWSHEPDKAWPEIVLKLQTRIGLNSGDAVVGNMGSHTRFNYTMMGDTVNLAARMESGAKSWGVYTMCTEATKQACQKVDAERVVFRALNKIVVKGRSQPVPIYEIVGLAEDVTAETRRCIEIFETGLIRYYASDWDGALACFEQSLALEPNQPGKTPGVESNPSLVLIKVTKEMKAHPPEAGWDGRYIMKEK